MSGLPPDSGVKATEDEEIEEIDVPDAVRKLPATYVNSYFISVTTKRVRITFSELIEGYEAEYRAALLMPTEDAESLARSILRLAQDARKAGTSEGV